jgi:2-polyprenyl-6-hydroxyphenyl methylase/3-demethylubiquinone-9 3-methyltransferase
MKDEAGSSPSESGGAWDHSSHENFYEYYAKASQSEKALVRFRHLRDTLAGIAKNEGLPEVLDVADIGGGAGTLAMVWAEKGHNVRCLDINKPLIELAEERASRIVARPRFYIGSATDIPWKDACVDICVAPELLEHISDWESCLDEFARILRPNGMLFISTTNSLCPKQNEFNLPLYSWYPGPLKRYCERLAVTTRPWVANYAKYPAVNWFTFYGLRTALAERGFKGFMDRFDMAASRDNSRAKYHAINLIRTLPPLRLTAQVMSPATSIVAIKGSD